MCISKNSMLYHLFYRHFYHGDVALRDRKVLEFSLPYFLSVELVTASRVFLFNHSRYVLRSVTTRFVDIFTLIFIVI